MKIKGLTRNENEWTWRVETDDPYFRYGTDGVYYTDKDGCGIFFQRDGAYAPKQITGTCQCEACETASGMRRKIAKWFED